MESGGQNRSQKNRQRPGSACQECRRRKFRCDGGQPQCEACAVSGAVCMPVTTHLQRGLKKGHVKALETRIASLEQQVLEQQQDSQQSQHEWPISSTQGENMTFTDRSATYGYFGSSAEEGPLDNDLMMIPIATSSSAGDQISLTSPVLKELSELDQLNFERNHSSGPFLNRPLEQQQLQQPLSSTQGVIESNEDLAINAFSNSSEGRGSPSNGSLMTPITTGSSAGDQVPIIPPVLKGFSFFPISDMLFSELDQLYFERTHPFVPFLNRHRYLSQSRQTNKKESQTCLQYAMWTMAAASSAQFQHIRDSTYGRTRQMLDLLEAKDSNVEFTDFEHAQARLLLFVHDFMRTNHQRGFISAGRCFRLVQLMRLYEIDSLENSARRRAGAVEDWIETEVKRRTFWVAYSLDRFISARHNWPLTLNEQDISTRLPAPEENFQSGQLIEMPFLSEGITSLNATSASPFTESIIIATICGRALTHRHQSIVGHVHSQVPQQFWERHEGLYSMLKTRYEGMLKRYPAVMQQTDCMLLFTNMINQTTVLGLCKVMESMPWESDQCRGAVMDFKQRSLRAAKEIVTLTRMLPHLSYFKVHPFTPLPLSLCVDFFSTHRYLDESANMHIDETLNVLLELAMVNNLAQDYLL